MNSIKFRCWDTKEKVYMDDEWIREQPIWKVRAEGRYVWEIGYTIEFTKYQPLKTPKDKL